MNPIDTYNWRSFCTNLVGSGDYGDAVMQLWRGLWSMQRAADETRAEYEGREIPPKIAAMLDEVPRKEKEAKTWIVAAMIPLVHKIANRMVFGRYRADLDDAIQDGLMAVMRAAECFDDRGTTFSTYTHACVTKAIGRWCEKQRRQSMASLDPQLMEERCELQDGEAQRRETLDLAREFARMVIENQAGLTDQERDTLIRYYGLGAGMHGRGDTLDDIGGAHGVTKQRVHQVRNSAHRKLLAEWEGRLN